MTNIFTRLALSALAVLALSTLSAQAQDADMSDHDMSGHDMSAMKPMTSTGSWSYLDRENPEVTFWERWETVPVAGTTGAFRTATGMALEERCTALLTSTTIIIDRTLKEVCGEMPPAPAKATDHKQHHDQ